MKITLRAMSIVLVLAAMFSFSDESFGIGRCRGHRCRPADPTPDPVLTAEPEPKRDPMPQRHPVTRKPDIYDVPPLDLSGCDKRGHNKARECFADKVGAGMGEILVDMKKETSAAIFSCKLLPGTFRKNCCKTTRDSAAKECKKRVEERANKDTECHLNMPNCRSFMPGCLRDRITEKKRAQCCTYLKPQGTDALLSFCAKAADLTTGSCDVPAMETPAPTWTPFDLLVTPTPTTLPSQPTAVPTKVPTVTPTVTPTDVPTEMPTIMPTATPTDTPDEHPTSPPTETPTKVFPL